MLIQSYFVALVMFCVYVIRHWLQHWYIIFDYYLRTFGIGLLTT
jgi:hypothetical protein